MSPTPATLSPRHTEILDGFTAYLQDDERFNEITEPAMRSKVKLYLLWLQKQTLDGDALDGPDARDRAVGFYKRELFRQGRRPVTINASLAALRVFYTWWGPGPHQVPALIVSAR